MIPWVQRTLYGFSKTCLSVACRFHDPQKDVPGSFRHSSRRCEHRMAPPNRRVGRTPETESPPNRDACTGVISTRTRPHRVQSATASESSKAEEETCKLHSH